MKNISDYNGNTLSKKKKYSHYFSFRKKDTIIRNIEIIVGIIVAAIVAVGVYGLL